MRAILPVPTPANFYTAYGLNIASSLPLPELLPGEETMPVEVQIRYGPVAVSLVDVTVRGVRFQANTEQFLLLVDNVARYGVSHGREIVIERFSMATDQEVRLFLLGSVMGALLHQRGILAIHASAIATDKGGAVFLGPSGCGKSTLAAALCRRGYRLLADDVCGLTVSPEGTPVVLPGYPQLKLWGDALQELGEPYVATHGLPYYLRKFGVMLPERFSGRPIPLVQLYLLTISNIARNCELTALRGLEKLTALIENTYRQRFLHSVHDQGSQFHRCSQVLQNVALKQVVRPHRPFLLTQLVDLLEEDLRA